MDCGQRAGRTVDIGFLRPHTYHNQQLKLIKILKIDNMDTRVLGSRDRSDWGIKK